MTDRRTFLTHSAAFAASMTVAPRFVQAQMETSMQSKNPALQYPHAKTVNQVDDYFGTKVADPYRWMEDVDSAEVKQWVDAENLLTHSVLDSVPGRAAMHARLTALTNFERFSAPTRYGSRYIYSHNTGLQNQSVLFWQEGLTGEPKVLLDPNLLKADGTVALSAASFTEDGTLMAYATSEAGSDWQTWRVRDVATGNDHADVVSWSKFSSSSWLHDGSGFFYSGYGMPAFTGDKGATVPPAEASTLPQTGSLKEVNSFQKIYFHKLGTPQSSDNVVFERPDDKEIYLGASISDDGRYLALYQSKGANNALTVKDLAHPDAPLIQVAPAMDAQYSFIGNDGTKAWLQINKNAPNGKVVEIDLAGSAVADQSTWKTVVPESKNRVDSVSLVHNTLIVAVQKDAHSQVELWSRDGKLLRTLELPGIGTAAGFGGRLHDTESFYAFTNFTSPSTIYRLDMKTLESKAYRVPKLVFDPAQYTTEQVFFASKDGTNVPMTLSYKKGLKHDGMNPTILYGYGGFDISLTPVFAASFVLWMEKGGIYAQANLRGGGEYGDAWHKAGTKTHKQNVFDDFIAAAEWLIAQRYTSTLKLAIMGGSNGGLLVGACELQRPELFGAAIAEVGVMDMLRFDKFTVGFGWKDDYGAPSEVKEEFEAIYKYSPLHNVKPGVKYPPTLITTADHDDRVFPAHSFKYCAALQAEDAARVAKGEAPAPILIRVETRAGHGGGMPLSKRIDQTVDLYSFLVKELKMEL